MVANSQLPAGAGFGARVGRSRYGWPWGRQPRCGLKRGIRRRVVIIIAQSSSSLPADSSQPAVQHSRASSRRTPAMASSPGGRQGAAAINRESAWGGERRRSGPRDGRGCRRARNCGWKSSSFAALCCLVVGADGRGAGCGRRRVVWLGWPCFCVLRVLCVGDGAGREGVAGLIGSAEEWGSSLVRGVSVSTKFKSGTRGATSFLVPGTARCCPGHAQHLTRLLQGGGGGWQRPAIGGRTLRHRWKLSFLHVLGASAAHTNLCPVLYPFSRRRDVISPSPDIARADLSIVVIKTMFGSSAPSIGSFYELQFHSREKTRRCESRPTSPFLELSHWARIAASSPKTSDIQHAYPAILWKMGIDIDIAT